MKRIVALCGMALVILSGNAQAGIITFETQSLGSIGGTLVTDSGFNFTLGGVDATNNQFFSWVGSGSTALGFNGANGVTITTQSSALFSVANLNIGGLTGAGPISFYLNGNAAPILTLPGLPAFTTVIQPWNNISSLRIASATGGDVLAIDNLDMTIGSFAAVPEPSSFALIGAIGAFGVWKRRRSQKVA